MNLDANQQLFFTRELEAVKTETYDIKYPELKARRLIPVNFNIPAGAKTITYRQYDMAGMAKVVANYANDFPKVTLKGKEFTSPIRRLGDSYSYTIDDIKAAAMAGFGLDVREAAAAKKAIMQIENNIAFFGDAASGLPGFFSNANIPEQLAPADGAGASSAWLDKSADLIIRDVSLAINTVKSQSNGVEMANTVLLPVSAMAVIGSIPRSSTSDTTVLEFLKRVHPQITLWEELVELETAGTGSTRMLIAYNRSPMALSMEVPEDFNIFPAQEKGLEFEFPCTSKTGGVIVYYPLSANKVYGF